ncbi:TerD family protein [Halomonas sp. BN3-1]|nr:TerD family protein [Halomonas sp. BN3-1]
MSINLSKGQRISLEKNGTSLSRIEIGVNWGAIKKTKKAFLAAKKQGM